MKDIRTIFFYALLGICTPVAMVLLIALFACFLVAYLFSVTCLLLFPQRELPIEEKDFSRAQWLLDNQDKFK